MEKIIELLKPVIEKSKTDRKIIAALKDVAVKAQAYELAFELRSIETEIPKTDEEKDIEKISRLFRMVGLNGSDKAAFLISEAIKGFNEKGDDFDLRSASLIITKANELFGKDD